MKPYFMLSFFDPLHMATSLPSWLAVKKGPMQLKKETKAVDELVK